jgi:multimeric flavodoxin WrbA
VEAVLKGAASKGAKTRLVNLRELDIRGCVGCDECKQNLGHCAQEDDLTPLLRDMAACDALVLGSPVYYYQVSSQTKTLLDRMNCFMGWEPHPESGDIEEINAFPEGKKIIIVTSRADLKDPQYHPEMYENLQRWLEIVVGGMRPSFTEHINHYGSWNKKKSAGEDAELMARAKAVGEALVGGRRRRLWRRKHDD